MAAEDRDRLSRRTPEQTLTEPLEQRIRQMTLNYQHRAKRLYRFGMGLRATMLIGAFLALLPDSALFRSESGSSIYGTVTTVAGVVGALVFLLSRNLHLVETMKMLNDLVGYLEDQSIRLLSMDGMAQKVAEMEIRKEVAAREAAVQQGVFSGLERYFGGWGGQGE